MPDRDSAAYADGEIKDKPKTVNEDPPPPYPGIPGADITSGITPLWPHQSGSQPGAPPQASPLTPPPYGFRPEYHPQHPPTPSAPPEDAAPYKRAQSENFPPIPRTTVTNPDYQYIPLFGPREHEGSKPESGPILKEPSSIPSTTKYQHIPLSGDRRRQQGATPAAEGDGPVTTAFHPPCIHPAPAPEDEVHHEPGGIHCVTCLMCMGVCCYCLFIYHQCAGCLFIFQQ